MSAGRPRRNTTRSKPSPHNGKPGPKPITPTTRQRHQVELAVAVGLSLEMIADGMDLSRRTLGRMFARELATGRAKKLLASVVRLDKLAASGNVSAAKFLHGLMMDHGNRTEAVEGDKWATVADQIEADQREPNLPKNSEFWKNN